MQPIVALVFSITSPNEPPFSQKVFFDSYKLLDELGKQRGISFRFVLGEEYRDGQFQSSWTFEGDELHHSNESFTPTLIYLQTRDNRYEYTKRLNNSFLEIVCRDKFITGQLFPKYVKKTLLVTNDCDLSKLLTERIVLKPQYGSDGEKVSVLSKNEFDVHDFLSERFVAQEFIDSSEGIPRLIAQRHEMRLYIFSGEIKAAYLRVPAPNSYLANISQGAVEQQFALSDLPQELYPLVEYVDAAFSDINPRLYTIDVMFEKGKPWIVELNDTPGMPDISVQPLTNTFFEELLTLIEQVSK